MRLFKDWGGGEGERGTYIMLKKNLCDCAAIQKENNIAFNLFLPKFYVEKKEAEEEKKEMWIELDT
jgi:hypothetical protein